MAVAAACVALAPWVVLPEAGDAFELPKRLVWGGLAAWLAWGVLRGKRYSGAIGLQAAWWGLFAWMGVRNFLGDGWGHWAAPWMAWAMPCAMFALAAANRWTEGGKRLLARAVAVSGFAEAVLMFFQWWGLDPLWGEVTREMTYYPARMVGTIGYQNQAAEFLGLAALCTAYGWRERWRWVAIGGILGVLVMSASRGAIAGVAMGALAMALVGGGGAFRVLARVRKRVWLAVAAASLAVLAGLASPDMRERVAELAHPRQTVAVRSRYWMARVAWAMWREHPWAGAGGGAYSREYLDGLGRLFPERKEHWHLEAAMYAREAHCDILQFGAEFGAVGVALLGILAWMVAVRIRRGPLADRTAAAGVAVFTGTCALLSFTWQTALAGPLAGLLLGAWCGGGEEAGGEHGPGWASRANAWGLALVAAGMLFWALLETARSLGVPGVPPKGTSLAEEGMRFLEAGHAREAVERFSEAERDVVSPAILRNHGAALADLERWDEATAVYQRWARCGIEHDKALWSLSVSHERAGRLADAAEAEDERLRLFYDRLTGDQFFRLSVLHLRAGNAPSARRVAERWHKRCNEVAPEKWTARWDNLMGAIASAEGNLEEARAAYGRALQKDPGLESARRNLDALAP